MFENYTDRARRVIFFARYEATCLGASKIDADHILLGVLREDVELSHRIQECIGLIRKEIEGRAISQEPNMDSLELPLSVETQRILGFATEEAELSGHNQVNVQHLLLGFLRESDSVAAQTLHKCGINIHDQRAQLASLEHLKDNDAPRDTSEKGIKATSAERFSLGGKLQFLKLLKRIIQSNRI